MICFLYNLLITLLAPLAIPYWIVRSLAKGHSLRSLPESLGMLPASIGTTTRDSVWFHAVSVGEVQSSLPLLKRLRQALPAVPIYVSTGTSTGRKLAENQLQHIADGVFRAPLDLHWCVSRVFDRLRPRLLIVAETELWPNYFFQAKRRRIPAMIVNGRISDRAAPKYRRMQTLFGPTLRCVDIILAQSETDRQRFIATGARPSATVIGGNLKYDLEAGETGAALPPDLRDFIDHLDPDVLFVAGSTREGEEEMLVPSLRALAEQTSGALAIVAPRHPHRFDEAAQVLTACGLPVLRRSRLERAPRPSLPAVLVLDSLGELAALYARADLVFVGGSLNGWGGHNVLEPVLHGKPVIVGPHMQNFRRITADLLGASGIAQVQTPAKLSAALLRLADDAATGRTLGLAGKAFAESQRGATDQAVSEAARRFRAAAPLQPPSTAALVTLGLPSAVWSAAALLRRRAYRRGILTSHYLSTPTVSIGNLTVGGTGKTPTVAWLVEQLASSGHAAAVLTRGYGRDQCAQIQLIQAGEEAGPRICGDEPAMLARRFATTAPATLLAVGADRHAAGRLAEKREGIAFLILDDGFQHMQVRRSLNIVLVASSHPFGNGHTLPLGRLREPVSSLADADIVMITRSAPGCLQEAVEAAARQANPDVRIFHSRMIPKDLINIENGEIEALDTLAAKRVATFCGIGNPGSFQTQARELGYSLVLDRAFRDHHRYRQRDLDRLSRDAHDARAEALLTTAKDVMNLSSAARLDIPAYALRIDLEVDNAQELLDLVLQLRAG